MRILLVILAALIVAGGTGFYVLQGLRASASPEVAIQAAAPTSLEVFVPARELAAGTLLKPEHFGRMQIAETAITAEMIVADAAGDAQLVGSVARQVLPQGVPIARSAIVQPGDRGFLAAVLPKGKRAITIPIGEVAGLSGLVLPGDRVDIILTYSVAGDIIDAGRDIRASETVMHNLRVLALDQRFQTGQAAANAEGEAEGIPIARAATLEVTPQQAEMITLATSLGALSMVLNSVRDGGEETDTAATETGPLTPTVAMRRARGAGAFRLGPREMTLDSDVTSLLQRRLPGSGDAIVPAAFGKSAVPASDRTMRVQIVRGSLARAIELGGQAAAAGAAGGAPTGTTEGTAAPATQ